MCVCAADTNVTNMTNVTNVTCPPVGDWWTTPSCELRLERTVSAVLVPLLLLLGVVARVGQYRGRGLDWADVLLSAGKPAADVAFVMGMGIQAQDYVAHDGGTAFMWAFSTVMHGLLVPAFAGAEVRPLWVALAVVVYALSLLVLGLMHAAGGGDNMWPYSLSPLVCLAFVGAYVTPYMGDSVAAALREGRSLLEL